jgi:predicted methyltransferase
MMKTHLLIGAAALVLFGCSKEEEAVAPAVTDVPAASTAAPQEDATAKLDAALASVPDAEKARFAHRHPKETIEFFGIVPGMTVVDVLPGEVWYTGILLDYLGPQGKVIGADYSAEMWSQFGEYAPKAGEKDGWPAKFVEKAQAWRDADDAQIGGVQFGSVPDDMSGTADVVLVSRALHHFTRMEAKGGYFTKALADINKMLKPGGIVAVEQHRAPETSADAWAIGEAGYIKQSAVIDAFKKAGFELVDQSEINANHNDVPTEKDIVWRLPPTLATSEGNAETKSKMEAIGESDRMTLKFRKPA